MVLPLVVGVDGSEASLLAVDWAVDEAARSGLPLRLLYASLWELYEGAAPEDGTESSASRVAAENILGPAAERARCRNPNVAVSTSAVADDAVSTLLAESRNASALVTGARGRGEVAGLLLGSVSLAVAARAYCPVVVVRGDKAGLAGTHERILLGVADPEANSEAVRFAFRTAAARKCLLFALRTWRCPSYTATDRSLPVGSPSRFWEERAAALLDAALHDAVADHPEVRVRRKTVEGPARKVLVHHSAAADLVVIGARRRHGHFGLQLSRVGHTLLHHAACPVAIVPQLT
ncbi:universal stress protein [Streptomyces venezuelae]|uniref:universal stress protein n=1 Tax=Streptomyces venezuelae TaxID=54571 RepID=UPI0037AE11A7